MIPEVDALLAIVGQEVDGTRMGVPDHLGDDLVDVIRYLLQIALDARVTLVVWNYRAWSSRGEVSTIHLESRSGVSIQG